MAEKLVPVRVVTLAEVPDKLSIVALVDFRVETVPDVIVALASDKLESVMLVTFRFVIDALP